MNKLIIYTDGGARGNPGPAAIGVIIYLESGQTKILTTIGKFIGKTTNNVAEYSAVIEAYRWIITNQEKIEFKNIEFYLDSNLVVNQLNGSFKLKSSHLLNLFFEIKKLQQKVKSNFNYFYIPREKNKEADAIVNKILDENINL